METLFTRKIYFIFESLLFGNVKITTSNFLRRCKKQNIKVMRFKVDRLVAFLQSLPRNLALFQALETAFKYIIEQPTPLNENYYELKAEYIDKKNFTYDIIANIRIYHKELKEYAYLKKRRLVSKKTFKYLEKLFDYLENIGVYEVYKFNIYYKDIKSSAEENDSYLEESDSSSEEE